MENQKRSGSAYREFRAAAYRNKYEPALIFGGRHYSYEQLLERIEQSYNTFRQMGVEPGERVLLWLPNCPDLICAFYALSRLGAVAVISHPKSSPAEIFRQMEDTGAERLMATAERYAAYCCCNPPQRSAKLILCRPEKDLRGRALAAYLQSQKKQAEEEQAIYWDEQIAQNRYHSGDASHRDDRKLAVVLYASSSFLSTRPIVYLPAELSAAAEGFFRHREADRRIYIEPSLAFEGGFLAAHSAFCSGREVLLGEEEKVALLKKYRPDFLIGTEELFWELRQRAQEFKGRWENLRGGILLGKEISPLMEKYAPRSFLKMGGKGELSQSPMPLKMRREELYYLRDFGVRLADMEARLSLLEEVEHCRCLPEGGGICLQVTAKGSGSKQLGEKLAAFCRREMGLLYRPQRIEFKRF